MPLRGPHRSVANTALPDTTVGDAALTPNGDEEPQDESYPARCKQVVVVLLLLGFKKCNPQ